MRQLTSVDAAKVLARRPRVSNRRFQCLALDSRAQSVPSHRSQALLSSCRRALSISHQPRSTPSSSTAPSSEQPPLNPRWLSSLKARLGKCVMFGLNPSQTTTASTILRTLSHDWQRLLVGSEGYLTSAAYSGLSNHRIVWGEQDSMGHVNNVMYVRYAESARVEWANKFAVRDEGEGSKERRKAWGDMWTPKGTGMILRSIKIDYKFPMTWPDRISVYHKLRSSPSSGDKSAFILDVTILSHRHQRPAARCIEDIVVYDYQAGKKSQLQPWMMEQFEEVFRLQEEEKRACLGTVAELEEKVRRLEKETWDRDDAKEDLGTAGS